MLKVLGFLQLPLYFALLSFAPATTQAGFAPHAAALPAAAGQSADKKPNEQKPASSQPSSPAAPADKLASDNAGTAAKDDTARSKPSTCNCATSQDSIEAFWWAFRVMTALVIVLVVVLIVSLTIFSFLGKWSLADALSEESSVQPNPQQVKMVASCSRLIALIGLMGILTVVLGAGYSIVWNLFTGGTLGFSLGDISKFLFAAATMFAPYLANQFRSIFDSSGSGETATPPPAPLAPQPKPGQ